MVMTPGIDSGRNVNTLVVYGIIPRTRTAAQLTTVTRIMVTVAAAVTTITVLVTAFLNVSESRNLV